MQMEITTVIAVLSLIVSSIVGYNAIRRAKTGEDKHDASEMTTLIVKLENISNGVNEIKTEIRAVKQDLQELRERIVVVEQSTKSAHKRLDELGVVHHD